MKVTVNRQLSGGQYSVRFAVSDFTPDELGKMNSFGIPAIRIVHVSQGARRAVALPINQISPNYVSSFGTEAEANEYQNDVLGQIAAAMKNLRERRDDFTSTQEVNI